jgi:Peptidase family M28
MMTRGARCVVAVAVSVGLLAGCNRTESDVRSLASDALGGRNNGTPGSVAAQDYIIGRLDDFAVGIDPTKTGADAFRMPFAGGTNVIGVIPGSDLADQFVVVGAHYDHLGSCRTADPADRICNGATDNATGVAAVLNLAEQLAHGHGPRRSVVLALWDREEDGLLGSQAYLRTPPVPLAQTVAYVNFDIQGANLSPSLQRTTFAVGAETGGEALQAAVDQAAAHGPLDTVQLSSIFGQGRSDYINFINARIPTVFFSDSTGPCYHTAQDEADIVDYFKLGHETRTALRLVRDLADTDDPPTFTASSLPVTYEDAVALQGVGDLLLGDLDRFTPSQQTTLVQLKAAVDAIVAAGPAEFGFDDVAAVANNAVTVINLLTSGPCDGFLRGHGGEDGS